jgi:hypothetical protein
VDYGVGGPLTAIDDELLPHLEGLPDEPIELCRVVQSLVVLPDLAAGFGIPEERQDERNVRPAGDLLRMLFAANPAPLTVERSPTDRVVGTCRHFSVLACALLRHRGIEARSRCGFATYFVPGKYVDHWVVERRDGAGDRWVRTDPEILGFDFVGRPEDLAEGEFLSGGEAWDLCRGGGADPSLFGVVGAPHAWGIAETRGNAVRDLAALNKVEVLPWDAWGRMDASYDGKTGDDYDELMDTLAGACSSDDAAAITACYESEDLAVPSDLLR